MSENGWSWKQGSPLVGKPNFLEKVLCFLPSKTKSVLMSTQETSKKIADRESFEPAISGFLTKWTPRKSVSVKTLTLLLCHTWSLHVMCEIKNKENISKMDIMLPKKRSRESHK